MSVPFLPRSLSARLALAGALTLMYIFFASVYLGYDFNPFSISAAQNSIDEVVQAPFEDVGVVVNHTDTVDTPSQHADADIPPTTTTTTGRKGPPVLLVSSIFPLEKQRHPQEKYDLWIKNYLGSITTHIYLYTTPEMAPQLEALRPASERLTLTIDTNYTTPFGVPPLKGKEEMYLRIQKKDREHGRRSNVTDLYAARNAKPFFLHSAVKNMKAQGVDYEYVFWNDIGSFHDEEHGYKDWPSSEKVEDVWKEGSRLSGMKKEELIFVPVFDPPHSSLSMWVEPMGPIDSKFSEGSFFGGTASAIDWFARAFYAYHDRFLSLELFIGKDTSLINTLVFLYPERFITVWHNDPSAPAHLALNPPPPSDPENPLQLALGQCGSVWHYYQFFLADAKTQETMRDLWILHALRWHWWGWWRHVDRTRCQDTRVLDLKAGVLKRIFGEAWNVPGHGLEVPQDVSWAGS